MSRRSCAGRVSKGEGSMEYIATDLGIEPVYIHELQREISVASDVVATARLRKLIHELRPDMSTPTRRKRARWVASLHTQHARRAPPDSRAHLSRARAPRLLQRPGRGDLHVA